MHPTSATHTVKSPPQVTVATRGSICPWMGNWGEVGLLYPSANEAEKSTLLGSGSRKRPLLLVDICWPLEAADW